MIKVSNASFKLLNNLIKSRLHPQVYSQLIINRAVACDTHRKNLSTLCQNKHQKFATNCRISQPTQTIMTEHNTVKSRLVPADRIKNEQESVWVEFAQLASEAKPLNMGQGLPDYPTAYPDHVTAGLAKVVTGGSCLINQYTRGFGHPRLVKAISELYSKLLNRSVDPNKEILVTVGAYEAIYCIINAFIGPEDEVIIIEPYYDCYEPMVKMALGKCVFVPLRLKKDSKKGDGITSSADWVLDEDELQSKITNKTKMLILNNPHNPLGKVFSRKELEGIAGICKRNDLLVLSDEVYEHLVLDGEHIRTASLNDMWERTITVGSAGKTFSVTGWKVGWCYGPSELIKYAQFLHQNCIYVCPTPLQEAVAESFEIEIARMGTPESYWTSLAASLKQKRDRVVEVLSKANMEPTVPEAGYFLLANTSNLSKKFDFSQEQGVTKDHKFIRWLSKNKKLQGIPPSAFYSADHKQLAEDFIRLCYFKSDTTLISFEGVIKKLIE